MRTVVITGVGGAGQVGFALARAFGSQRDHVVIVGRDRSATDARARELQDEGASCSAFHCDLTDSAAVENLGREVGQRSPHGVAALVLAAGGFASGTAADTPLSVLDEQLSISLRTAYLATHVLLPQVRVARGSIVYFASASVLPGGKAGGMAAYSAAKSGVLGLMRAVAQEERGAGVRANAIAPEAVRTAANQSGMGVSARYVELSEVAAAVTFLCSDAASAVTGDVLHLAGLTPSG
jgi:NAD(P)-dependent dehydrogenase (short-subunit alcohol dehydrogenase family)